MTARQLPHLVPSSFVDVRDPIRLVPRTASQPRHRGVHPCPHDHCHGARCQGVRSNARVLNTGDKRHASTHAPTPTEAEAARLHADMAHRSNASEPPSSAVTRSAHGDADASPTPSTTYRCLARSSLPPTGLAISYRHVSAATTGGWARTDARQATPPSYFLSKGRMTPHQIPKPNDRPGFASNVSGGL